MGDRLKEKVNIKIEIAHTLELIRVINAIVGVENFSR